MALPKLNKQTEEVKKQSDLSMPSLGEIEETIVHIEDDENYEEEFEIEDITPKLSQEFLEKEEETQFYENPMEFDSEESSDGKFVDRKKRKIIPFGGKKSKTQTIKSGDFDERKNTMTVIKIFRAITLIVVLALFVLGIKNTFFPSNNYTKEEIENIAQSSVGQLGFPTERGQAFVEDFMEEFLAIDPENAARMNALSFFYTGQFVTTTITNLRLEVSKSTTQEILISPKVYSIEPISSYSTLYKVSAYVTDTTGVASEGNTMSGRWLSFAINVFYDEETDSLAITPDSPALIPNSMVGNQNDVPQAQALGTGIVNNDMLQVLTPTIDGYVNAFALASISSHNEIVQYIPTNAALELYTGFGGAVEVKDKNNGNIKKVVYDSSVEGEYKVDVTVTWVDKASTGGENQMSYVSQYVMTITRTADNKYLVTGFKPYYFIQR